MVVPLEAVGGMFYQHPFQEMCAGEGQERGTP